MKLLLVDDDAIERTALRDILRAQGPWTIEESSTGREALERLGAGLEPLTTFLDVRMPGLDGVQVLSEIRQTPLLRHLRVVMTSSTRDRDTIVNLGKLGIAGYLTKPYDLQKTTSSLNQLVGSVKVATSHLVARNLLAKTMLIVDDDSLVRTAIRSLFSGDDGWEIVEAEDGLTALELLRGGLRPDLALLDLRMPRLDGHTFLTRVREDPHLRNMPVVVASGQQDRERIRSLAQLRISGYLLKPLDLEKTRALIQQVAANSRTGSAAPI